MTCHQHYHHHYNTNKTYPTISIPVHIKITLSVPLPWWWSSWEADRASCIISAIPLPAGATHINSTWWGSPENVKSQVGFWVKDAEGNRCYHENDDEGDDKDTATAEDSLCWWKYYLNREVAAKFSFNQWPENCVNLFFCSLFFSICQISLASRQPLIIAAIIEHKTQNEKNMMCKHCQRFAIHNVGHFM